MEDQDKPKKRKLQARRGLRKKSAQKAQASDLNDSIGVASDSGQAPLTAPTSRSFTAQRKQSSDDMFDAFQETYKQEALDQISNPDYFESLLANLHYPQFESRELSSEERSMLVTQLKIDIDRFKPATVTPLIQALIQMHKDKQIMEGIKRNYPQAAEFSLKKEAHFLKALTNQSSDFIHSLKSSGFQNPSPELIEKVKELKKSLTFYYLHFAPTMLLIQDMKPPKPHQGFKGFIDKLKHAFKPKGEEVFNHLQASIDKWLPECLNAVNNLENLIAGLNVLLYGKELHHQLLGEIQKGVYSVQDLKTLAHGLLEFIPAAALLPAWQDNYTKARPSERFRLLHFLNALLEVDSHKMLFEARGESPLLHRLLPTIEAHLEEPKETQLFKHICKNIELRKAQVQNTHQRLIQKLQNNVFPIETLNEIIKMKVDDYYLGMASLRDCCQLCYDIIQNLSAESIEQNQNSTLNLLYNILSLIPLPQHVKLYECLDTLLERKLHSKFSVTPDWAKPMTRAVHDETFGELDEQFNRYFEGIAQNTLPEQDIKKFIENIASRIRAQFSYLVIELDLIGLKKATWRNQLPANVEDMGQFKLLPNLSKLLSFEKQTRAFVPDLILYKVASPKELRRDPEEALRLFNFCKAVQEYANQKGWTLVSHFLGQGLLHPSLQSITLGTQSLPELSDQVPVEWLKREQMPRFSRVFGRLQSLSKHYTQTQKCFVLGRMFEKMSQVQSDIQKSYKESASLMYDYLDKRIWMNKPLNQRPSEFSLKEWTDLDIQYNLVAKAQYMVLHELDDISAQELSDRFEVALEHHISPLLLNSKLATLPTPKALDHLLDSLAAKITQAMPLPRLATIFNVVDQLSRLPNFRGRLDPGLQANRMLKLWIKRVTKLVEEGTLDHNQIQALKEKVESLNESIPKSIKSSSSYDSFSSTLNELELSISDWLPGARHGHSRAYIKTLAKYLEGEEQEQLKMPVAKKEAQEAGAPMMISLDFEDIEEESDPNLIGFAETWNVFQQVAENLVEGPPFSYENIKKSLLEAFSWAITDSKEAHMKPLQDNLLNVDPNVIAQLQHQVLSLVYIALDTIGKLAGPHGEYVLHNLNKIDPIISSLEFVSRIINDTTTLQNPEEASHFMSVLQERTSHIKEKNRLLCRTLEDKKDRTTAAKLTPNPQVNSLMSLNEKESFRHLIALLPNLESVSVLPETSQAPVSMSKPEEKLSETTEIDEWQALSDEVSNLFKEQQNSDFEYLADQEVPSASEKPKPSTN